MGETTKIAMKFPQDFGLVECAFDKPGAAKRLIDVLTFESAKLQESSDPTEDLKPILRIVLASLNRTYDPLIRKKAGCIWSLLIRNGGKTTFEGCFACLTTAAKRTESPAALTALVDWSCSLASAAAFTEAGCLSGPPFSKLAILQFSLIGRVFALQSTTRQQKRCSSLFSALLFHNAAACAQYLEAAAACRETAEVIGAVRALMPFCSKSPHADSARKTFTALYTSAILAATEGRDGRRPTDALNRAFDPWFRSLSHDDLAALLPEMCRILRRTPELYLQPLAHSLCSLSIDTSRYVSQFSAVLCERLAAEKTRDDALALTAALARQSSDSSALVSLGSDIHKTLSGKGPSGPVKSWQERLGLISALATLLGSASAGGSSGTGLSPLADECLAGVMALADKEANDGTKCVAVRLVGSCMRRANTLSADALKFLVKGLESPVDPLRRAFLDAVREALEAPTVRAKSVDLLPPLSKLLAQAEKKPGLRGDAALAARAAATIHAADPRASDARLAEAKFWPAVISGEPFLRPLLESDAGSEEELVAVAELLDYVLRNQSAMVSKAVEKDRRGFLKMLVALLSHGWWRVHRAAAAAVRWLRAEMAELLPEVMNELHAAMRTQAAAADARRAAAPSGEDSRRDGCHSALRFTRALLALMDTPPPAPQLGQLLLLAHSPAVLSGPLARDAVGRPRTWALLRRQFERGSGGSSGGFSETLRERTAALCEALMGEGGMHSGDGFDRRAALDALASLSQGAFRAVFPAVFETLRTDLDPAVLLGFSSRELVIYRTPEGQLARFAEMESGYVPQVREDVRVRVSKEERKMYGDLARELGKGKEVAAAKPKMTKQEEEAFRAKLAEEAAVRSAVASARSRAELALEALERVCAGSRGDAHAHLGELCEVVYTVCPCSFLAEALPRTVRVLVACCGRRLPVGLSEGLFLVARAGGGVALSPAEEEVVRGAAAGALDAIGRTPLPAESLATVFPLLRHALLAAPPRPELQDAAMGALGLHTDATAAWPRPRMLAVLAEALAAAPRLRKPAAEAMVRLAAGLQPGEVGELLDGGLSPSPAVRAACLDALARVPGLSRDSPHVYLQSTLLLLRHDADEAVREKAEAIYERCGFGPETLVASHLTQLLSHNTEGVRRSASEALAVLLRAQPSAAAETVAELKGIYLEHKHDGGPFEDHGACARGGVALALRAVAESLTKRELIVLFPFLVSDKGQGLSDPAEAVRAAMTQAGLRLIELHGEGAKELLTPMFENQINKPDAGTVEGDLVKEGVVLFLAALAKFLPKGDAKVKEVLARLVRALRTPSEPVQRAAAAAMSPLMPMLAGPDEARSLVQDMLDMLLGGASYGDRRGAAFGLAGMVKGLGISALKAHDVMSALQAAAADKKSEARRQGALFGFECLSERLGRLFEPYVVHVLPLLLNACGDADSGVREAADAAARSVMSQLSGQGVKLVLPSLLQGVEDRAWRTKAASIDLLGAMAYCAPRQLGTCLPTIVPVLAAAVSDTHARVREGARAALGQVGRVIKNPEILAVASVLVDSLSDSEKGTARALEVVIETTFVNAVDAPSLALLVPVVVRGLQSRNTDMKKKASTIVGNMCNLVSDPKDVAPYLNDLLPALKVTILDPSPEVRAGASKALGSLVRSMDDSDYAALERHLLTVMQSEASLVERAGAAQGLGEVLGASPAARLEGLLDELLAQCAARAPHVREGHFALLACLPAAMGDALEPYIPRVLPAILGGLSDEKEPVREIALRAGHGLVDHYAETAMPLVLPAIEQGLFDDAWRIRASSVHLLGDVLSKITGRNWKIYSSGGGSTTVDDMDEGTGDKGGEAKIGEVLGLERRDRLLSAVYMLRSDVNPTVCVASFQVWKSVVQSQSRTLRIILPTLMATLVGCLASPSEEKQAVAGRAMGEMVAKIGERVLPEVIPLLREGLASPDPLRRAGVCLGLGEVMGACSRPQIHGHLGDLVATVLQALCDRQEAVRLAAVQAFDALHRHLQHRAVEEVVPALLAALSGSEDGNGPALDGLRQLLATRGKLVLPFLVPRLVAPPMTSSNARALAALADVAGDALSPRIPTVLGALIDGMCGVSAPAPAGGRAAALAAREFTAEEEEERERVAVAAEKVVLAVPWEGVRLMLLELMRRMEDLTTAKTRAAAARLTRAFCAGAALECYEEHQCTLVVSLVHLFGDSDPAVLAAAHAALSTLVSRVEAAERDAAVKVAAEKSQEAPDETKVILTRCGLHVAAVLEEVRSLAAAAGPAVADAAAADAAGGAGGVAGFGRPDGLAPVLPFFMQAMLAGATPEAREQGAEGLGELVLATPPAVLKSFAVAITGALIRVITDRFPWQVKAAILKSLGLVLARAAGGLKAFLPQLQSVLLKCLTESHRVVRARCVRVIARFVAMGPRVDPLITELISGARTAPDKACQACYLQALETVLGRAGAKAKPPAAAAAVAALDTFMADSDPAVRAAAAAASGARAAAAAPDAELAALVESMAGGEGAEWEQRHGRALALAALLRHLQLAGRGAAAAAALAAAAAARLRAMAVDDRAPVREAAAGALGQAMRVLLAPAEGGLGEEEAAVVMPRVAKLLAGLVVDSSPEVRVAGLAACKLAGRSMGAEKLRPHLPLLAPGVFAGLKDKTTTVRSAAERAMLHLMQLYAGVDLATGVAGSLKEAEAAGLLDYCRRVVDKGADATAVSDDDDDVDPSAAD